MDILYTYTLYTGAEIADYIENNPTSLLAKEFIRKYYTDIASGGWWLEPSFLIDKKYYINSYTGLNGKTYKINRATRLYLKENKYAEEIE